MVNIVGFLLQSFEKAMHGFELPHNSLLAVACSGGPDSMALALLAKQWADANGYRLIALTVDHGLRPESATEATYTANWLESLGIDHRILVWEGAKPTTNIQQQARIARYRLMADYCAAHRISCLLIAHTADDQAETFLLRLARGSGVDGLSAMAPRTPLYGITLLRPLLATRKAELLPFLEAHKQEYIADPSNSNSQYDRVKIRKLLPLLAEIGLTPERLNATAKNMSRARHFLEQQTAAFSKAHCRIFDEGYALLERLPGSDEIALRVLADVLMTIGGHPLRPRLSDLERLYAALSQDKFKSATLAGCLFFSHKSGFLVLREMKAVAAPVAILPGGDTFWDHRFILTASAKRKGLCVGPLTQAHWLTLARSHRLCNPYPSKKILYTLPAVYDAEGGIVAVPHIGFGATDVTVAFRQRGRGEAALADI